MSVNRSETDWELLLDSLRDETCVLVVGPDVVRTEGETLFDSLSARLRQKFSEQDLRIYPSEELFHFATDNLRFKIWRELREFYAVQSGLNTVYERLANLPVSLIISLIPDKGLYTVLTNHQAGAQFGYQPPRYPPQEVSEPTRRAPLVYNLLSVNDNQEKLILTFDDLFEYLSGVLGEREFPLNLKTALERASTFVFLGVQFDKWYMQLLLKKICRRKAYRAASDGPFADPTLTFVMANFSLEFVNLKPTDFVDEWQRRCQQAGLLRSQTEPGASNPPAQVVASPPARTRHQVFISYQRDDVDYMRQLRKWLNPYIDSGQISIWDDESIRGGQLWESQISAQLASTRVFILLLSIEFLYSDYCWDVELKYALEKYQSAPNGVVILPVLIRDCPWHEQPLPVAIGQAGTSNGWEASRNLGNFQALPKTEGGKLVAVSDGGVWTNPDKAWKAVADEVKKVIAKLG